ncbi:hypothetical protein CONPUDRAFT_157923 [Coniophora puteana RWD-64-598 SS2]|uniref:Uncharacterized protein n=1 Tax=Coniophora puteana (strain RWD-64-598) TaxID=741705 RepID=A0A5M3MBZ5_CONPW|nr:uncharacterized protein CONPUDRAFT_157923 [Coniophora puteana RWD-64-598 SS2]EIW76758.1 hypothetical protein CONPUDRAFT_157923 [Coniophora puteana RWD-64-598 SS2]
MSQYVMSFINNNNIIVSRHSQEQFFTKTNLHNILLFRSWSQGLATLANFSDAPHTTMEIIFGMVLKTLDTINKRVHSLNPANHKKIIDVKFNSLQGVWQAKQRVT